jgi:hypothetical protein
MICANIGKKTDKIVAGRWAGFHRWAKKRGFRFHHPRSHAEERHVNTGIKDQFLRVLGELDNNWATTKHAGVYNSIDNLEQARLKFISENERQMAELAKRIQADTALDKGYAGWVQFDEPIGKGASLMTPHRGVTMSGNPQDSALDRDRVRYTDDVREAFVKFEFNLTDGCWYEKQNFPAVKSAYEAETGSGPVVHL